MYVCVVGERVAQPSEMDYSAPCLIIQIQQQMYADAFLGA